MNIATCRFTKFKCFLLSSLLVLASCNKENANTQSPQIPDKDSVGCLITNDFYAVHFSAYLKPTGDLKNADRAALLKPYCQDLPSVGKVFFSADLIDNDIRQTPIALRIVELEKIKNAKGKNNFKEIRTLAEVPAQLYTKGVVEAQADIDKNGDYALVLLIGNQDVISDDEKFKIPFHVGDKPLSFYGLSGEQLLAVGSGIILMLLGAFYGLYRLIKRKNSNTIKILCK